jgi:hypothetical protein
MASLVDRLSDLIVRLRTVINERGLPSGGTTGQVLAKASAADRAVAWVNQAGGGGASLSGTAIITVPAASQGSLDHSETVAALGVLPTRRIMAALAPHDDADENHEDMIDLVTLSARAGTDQITFNVTFSEPTCGPIKLIWSAL